jgi:predicted transcriptional regulator
MVSYIAPMPLSVRLDPETERALNRLARRLGQARSAVVRKAIAALAEREETSVPRFRNQWEAMKHLIGVADSGGARLSERTGEKYRALLHAKARARRID